LAQNQAEALFWVKIIQDMAVESTQVLEPFFWHLNVDKEGPHLTWVSAMVRLFAMAGV